ncbi:fucolectin-7-like isoform 2-T2 [Menidia menidia]
MELGLIRRCLLWREKNPGKMLWVLLLIFVIGGWAGDHTDKCISQSGDRTECCKGAINLKEMKTSQSSDHKNDGVTYSADRAIDGNKSTCSNTEEKPNSWWRIDLRGVYNISCISIFNKNGKNTEMENSVIYIGNSRLDNGTSNTRVANISCLRVCNDNVFRLQPTVGRYITVVTPSNKPTILCEVNITASEKESPFILIEQEMIWEDALYYCQEHHSDLASILDDEAQAFAELEAEKAKSGFVWLGLHFTCTLQFWFWVGGTLVDFNRWNDTNTAADCNMSGAMDKGGNHSWVKKSDFEAYNFLCEKRK